MDQRPDRWEPLVEFVLYVEGGGETKELHDACRRGFRLFLEKVGLVKNRPRIVAGGSRRQAYEKFCTALRDGKHAVLLVDSETQMTETSPWTHLRQRPGDGWAMPDTATDDHCHPMVQCMENWFLADRATLRSFFGQGFKESALPPVNSNIETIPKDTAVKSLSQATKDCKTKARYDKGEHSFDLLARIDPAKVTAASKWADRFVTTVR